MTEQEYLDATNLVKARIASSAARDILFLGNDDDLELEQHQRDAERALRAISMALDKRVDIQELE